MSDSSSRSPSASAYRLRVSNVGLGFLPPSNRLNDARSIPDFREISEKRKGRALRLWLDRLRPLRQQRPQKDGSAPCRPFWVARWRTGEQSRSPDIRFSGDKAGNDSLMLQIERVQRCRQAYRARGDEGASIMGIPFLLPSVAEHERALPRRRCRSSCR